MFQLELFQGLLERGGNEANESFPNDHKYAALCICYYNFFHMKMFSVYVVLFTSGFLLW